ncbi:MAG: thioredoxin domain-containing protein [Armatimonadota bacterium]
MATPDSASLVWYEWNDDAFEKAQIEDKLILLNITASWCHWCHVMDRSTFSDSRVIDLLNERFVPIRVDADRRPDIQDRYLLGGWPTTVFLIPDGRILTGTTFLPPDAMVNKLREVDALYHEQKSVVTMHVTSMAAEAEYERSQAELTAAKLNGQVIESIVKAVKKEFDHAHGGFGTKSKFPSPDAIHLAFVQFREKNDEEMFSIALRTLDAMTRIHDDVWGGFYRYAQNPDWSHPHYEKLLYVQAGAVDNYVEAYQITGDDKYGEIAARVESYVRAFLSDQERGGFYGSQDADVNGHDPSAELIPGEEYYSKGESERQALGIPYVDKTMFTNWNGMMTSAYLRLYQAMGDRHALDFALKTVDRILTENSVGDCMAHYSDGEPRVVGLLSDQVYFGLALLHAYQCSGRRKYLSEAEKLANFMVAQLQDVVEGGFYFQPFDPHAKGELFERHKPFDENVAAAQFLSILHHLTGSRTYLDLAERTLRATAYPGVVDNIIGAGYAVALDMVVTQPVHVVVVGDKHRSETQKMLETSLHAYEPKKIVQVLDPEEDPLTIGETTYEAQEEPLTYVCVLNTCRPPVHDSEQLVEVLEDAISDLYPEQ